jgi:hypothetical protein
VEIDRPEDSGTVPDAPDRPAHLDRSTQSSDATTLPGPEQRAEVNRNYRTEVDHAYDTARSGSADVVPDLRAAWDKHVEKYPEGERPVPRTLPDGSWTDGADRGLTPEQNADASRACVDIRKEGKEVILPAMQRIEAADPNRRLAGLKHMLKGEDRLKEKVSDVLRYHPDWTAQEALNDVPDAVRYTFAYGEMNYTNGVRADVDRLKADGFELVKLKNLWAKEHYKGINSQWRMPETGLRFEVQFHTPTSHEAKEMTHRAYERLRNPATSKDEEVLLEDYQRGVNVHVPLPPHVFEIEDYPREKRDD